MHHTPQLILGASAVWDLFMSLKQLHMTELFYLEV